MLAGTRVYAPDKDKSAIIHHTVFIPSVSL